MMINPRSPLESSVPYFGSDVTASFLETTVMMTCRINFGLEVQ